LAAELYGYVQSAQELWNELADRFGEIHQPLISTEMETPL